MKRAILSFVGAIILAFRPGVGLAQAPPPKAGGTYSLKPLAESAWDYAKARHLLFRAGFGGSPDEVEKLHAMGLHKAVTFLVHYQNQKDVDLPVPEEAKNVDPKKVRQNDVQLMKDIQKWWVRRMIESPRPLEEKMVLFWHSIIASEYRTVRKAQAMLKQNQLFRTHAAGNYAQLLHGVPRDPAMLRYLDNNKNIKGRANENLAREIMELFSMGEGQGYAEKDIKEAARALTGYNYHPRTWEFVFNQKDHDTGPKTIFGKTGNWNGDSLVDLILEQPATAKFIAKRLFTYFVQEEPDAKTIDQLAKVLRDHKYDLGPVLKTIFLSEYFYSPQVAGNLIKSPVQLVVGTIRTLGIRDADPAGVAVATRAMGQDLFDPPNVKGWDGGREWINSATLFARQNFAVLLVSRSLDSSLKGKVRIQPKIKGEPPFGSVAKIDLVELLSAKKLETSEAVVDYFVKALFLTPISDSKRAELVQFLGPLPPSTEWANQRPEISRRLGGLLILMMSMPEYQLT